MLNIFSLNWLKDWKHNRNVGKNALFSASFSADLHPNFFIPLIIKLLGNNISEYYLEYNGVADTDIEKYKEIDFQSVDIYTDSKLPIESIFLRKNKYSNSNFFHTILSIGLGNTWRAEDYKQLEHLLKSEKLIIGYYEEQDYIFWQNCVATSAYTYKRGLTYTRNSLGEKIVDTAERPGRTIFNKYFRYSGSSKIWFGPEIYQYISQEKILGFEGAVEIKVLEHNITFVNLYETVYDGDEPNNQEVQRRFREHVGIDILKVE